MPKLIWKIKPDPIIVSGIAHGGSLIFGDSILSLMDMSEAIESSAALGPKNSKRKALDLDIDIRQHNREVIEASPMSSCIQMIQGYSISPEVIHQVKAVGKNYQSILVRLCSNHTHDHILAELEAYAPQTSVGSYCVVFDTIFENMPKEIFPDCEWGAGRQPQNSGVGIP